MRTVGSDKINEEGGINVGDTRYMLKARLMHGAQASSADTDPHFLAVDE
jgi:hypothetical protein